MNLFSEFDDKRGVKRAAPPPPPPKPETNDVAATLKLAFAGGLKKDVLIPVLPVFQEVYGERFWLCPDEDKAREKQRTSGLLAFYPGELKLVMDLAARDKDGAARLTMAKRIFCGQIK